MGNPSMGLLSLSNIPILGNLRCQTVLGTCNHKGMIMIQYEDAAGQWQNGAILCQHCSLKMSSLEDDLELVAVSRSTTL